MVGLGVDVAELATIRRMLEKYPEAFMRRILSDKERALASEWLHPSEDGKISFAPRLVTFMAGRWCGKEAVMKALQSGLGTLDVRHIQILPNASGAPQIELIETALAIAEAKGVKIWHLSITHERTVAVAVAIAL